MKIAILSDIHANQVALDAVLKSLRDEAPDQIVFLGDLALFGPQPHETIAAVQGLSCTAAILGNIDEWLLDPQPAGEMNFEARRGYEIVSWGVDQVSSDEKQFLRSFQKTALLQLGDLSLLCCHGSPRSNQDGIFPDTPEAELEPMLAGIRTQLVASGHTHIQMLRRSGEITVINPGSVGFPVLRRPGGNRYLPWAEYALLTGEEGRFRVEFRREPLEVNEIARTAHASGMPHADWWLDKWV